MKAGPRADRAEAAAVQAHCVDLVADALWLRDRGGATCIFLSSDAAASITGEDLDVNAGGALY